VKTAFNTSVVGLIGPNALLIAWRFSGAPHEFLILKMAKWIGVSASSIRANSIALTV
jgi:hypothetical protein